MVDMKRSTRREATVGTRKDQEKAIGEMISNQDDK
jgi:hypothetical protein